MCIVVDCTFENYAFGLCNKHYQAHRRGIDLGVPIVRTKGKYGKGCIHHGYHVVMHEGRLRGLHDVMAEKVLGRALKDDEQIHHVNEIKHDNRPENLVICPDTAYHRLLHIRQKALDTCGNPDYRRCQKCGAYSNPSDMIIGGGRSVHAFMHSDCKKAYRQKLAARAKGNLHAI